MGWSRNFFSRQCISPREAIGPLAVPVFLRKPIVTCNFPGGSERPVPPPSGSAHVRVHTFNYFKGRLLQQVVITLRLPPFSKSGKIPKGKELELAPWEAILPLRAVKNNISTGLIETVHLRWCFTSQPTTFHSCWDVSCLLGCISTRQRIKCHSQGHNPMPPVRLKLATLRPRV